MLRPIVLALLILGVGCHKNEKFCENANPNDNCLEIDAPVDTTKSCVSSAECAPQVCDLTGSKVCVQCTAAEPAACTGTTPACVSNACEKCTSHAQCASAACLPDGSCAAETSVAYVDPGGTDNALCSKAMACTKVAKALATSRPYLKFTGTTNEQVALNNRNVTFLADPGAKLSDTINGILLRIDGTSQVTIYDLEITGASGASNPGISMQPGNTATLTMVRGRVTNNAGGGISISGGQFDITNSIVARNGSGSSVLGGIRVDGIVGAGTHRLEFNTVTANLGPSSLDTGISCGTVLTALTFTNNIIFANLVGGGGKQIGGSANCTTTYSDIGPDPTVGTGNINMDPMFVNAVQNNFHLAPGSPCKDAADPAASLPTDIDGDTRPQGSARDMGADEVKP